jgi:hypothetical protein
MPAHQLKRQWSILWFRAGQKEVFFNVKSAAPAGWKYPVSRKT